MPQNKNIEIERHLIKRGTREEDGAKLVIVKIIVREKKGKRCATVYIGKASNRKLPYEIKGNIHLTPFNGCRAANAAFSKARTNIKKKAPSNVFEILARI